MKICNVCGIELPNDAVYCKNCGEKLLRQCSICGTELRQDYSFCPKCGNTITEKNPQKSTNDAPDTNIIPTQAQISNIQENSSYDAKPHPWVRFWARSLDTAFFSLIFLIAFVFLITSNIAIYLNIFTVIILACVICWGPFILEAWCLSIFQTTPGKKLLKIKILPKIQNKISFNIALSRSMEVLIRGLWLGFFPFSLIPLGISYDKLQKYKITEWDKRLSLDVKHTKVSLLRLLLCIILLYIILSVNYSIINTCKRLMGIN